MDDVDGISWSPAMSAQVVMGMCMGMGIPRKELLGMGWCSPEVYLIVGRLVGNVQKNAAVLAPVKWILGTMYRYRDGWWAPTVPVRKYMDA
jgi:hypothetical protein